MSLSINIGRPFLNDKTLDEQARSILRLYGTNAHVYLPGANGVAVSGLLSNNYTLSDGSTGYSAIDGTAGLVLDGAGSVGAELVTNGGFDVDANWTKGAGWSITGGAAVASGATANLTQAGVAPSPVGKTYKVSLAITAFTSGSIIPQIGGSMVTLNAAGNYTFYLTPTGNDATLYIATGGFTGTIDNVSVKQVTGIHATQSTTANKPALRRGLYNLLTYSNDLSNAVWPKVNATIVTGQTDHNGGTSACKFVESLDGTGTVHLLNRSGATVGAPQTVFALVKPAGRTQAALQLGTGSAYFDVSAGSVVSGSGTIAQSTNGFWCIALNGTPSNINSILYIASGGTATYQGDGASGLIVDGVGVVNGLLSAQQILAEGGIPLTTSTAASNSGAGRYSWQFDGANDSLLTGNLAITNAACITIAGRLDSLAATSVLFGEDTGGVSISVATNGAVSFDKLGTGALVTSSAGLIVAGTPFVLTCRLSGGTAVIRKNGTQSTSSASGTTFSATTGARLGGTFAGASYCTGALSQIDVIVGAVTDADALTLERNAASNLVAGPTF